MKTTSYRPFGKKIRENFKITRTATFHIINKTEIAKDVIALADVNPVRNSKQTPF